MKTLEEYFTHVRQLIQSVPDAHAEQYQEQMLSATRGNLRIRLRFSDQAVLEISEALVFIAGEPQWLSYRYHYQVDFWRGAVVEACISRRFGVGQGKNRERGFFAGPPEEKVHSGGPFIFERGYGGV
jgi:hypothetical protein